MGRVGAGNKFNPRRMACPSGQTMANFQWLSNEQQRIQTINLTFFHRGRLMQALTQYGRMAEKHWREHCPKLVRDLEAQGQQFRKQGLTAQQAHDRAWEMVREEYILLAPES
jgi:hypothetical protein